MRIIAGKYRGKRLLTPKSMKIRPTEDRIKEAVFNILVPLRPEADVLDLCAGTGSISLEFASRGVASITIVEKEAAAIELIEQNIALIDEDDLFTIYHTNADKAVKELYRERKYYDYIYFDPPYSQYHLYDKVINRITQLGIMHPEGWLIVESDKGYNIKSLPPTYVVCDHRQYRDTTIDFIQFRGEKNGSNLSG